MANCSIHTLSHAISSFYDHKFRSAVPYHLIYFLKPNPVTLSDCEGNYNDGSIEKSLCKHASKCPCYCERPRHCMYCTPMGNLYCTLEVSSAREIVYTARHHVLERRFSQRYNENDDCRVYHLHTCHAREESNTLHEIWSEKSRTIMGTRQAW